MNNYIRNLMFFCLTLAAVAAASPADAGQPAPKEPPAECYCDECGMSVKGEGARFTSEIIMKDGKTHYFCDLGDLFLYYEVSKKKKDIAAMYVKGYNSGGWLDARSAGYLTGASVKTPMRYGIIAFKDKAAAEAFKKTTGGKDIYTFDGIIASRVYRR